MARKRTDEEYKEWIHGLNYAMNQLHFLIEVEHLDFAVASTKLNKEGKHPHYLQGIAYAEKRLLELMDDLMPIHSAQNRIEYELSNSREVIAESLIVNESFSEYMKRLELSIIKPE